MIRFDNDFAIKSKYHDRDLCYLVLNSSYLEFTRCYYSEYVLCSILNKARFSYFIQYEQLEYL